MFFGRLSIEPVEFAISTEKITELVGMNRGLRLQDLEFVFEVGENQLLFLELLLDFLHICEEIVLAVL